MSRLLRVLCAILCFALPTACGASQPIALDSAVAGGKTSVSVPFDLIDNRIVIDIKLNNHGPYRFIFDSGAVAVVSIELARATGLKLEGLTRAEGGVGENAVERGQTHISNTDIGGLRITDQEYGVLSFADNKYVFGANPIDGIIGYPFFKRFVVRIDYERRLLTFTDPSQFEYKGKGTAVPIDFDNHLPLVKGELDGVSGVFVIDTGARSALLLYGPFVEQHRLREKYRASIEGVTGWGIGGPVRSQIARVRVLRLGAIEVKDLVARLSLQRSGALASSDRAALVGPDVLKQFTTIFDYSRRQIIFEKNAAYGKPDSYDRAGMWFGLEGDYFDVIDVMAGGPAAEAGIKVGDHILVIDGQSASSLDLPSVRLRFRNDPPKKRVRLLVEHDGETREVVITLRDLV